MPGFEVEPLVPGEPVLPGETVPEVAAPPPADPPPVSAPPPEVEVESAPDGPVDVCWLAFWFEVGWVTAHTTPRAPSATKTAAAPNRADLPAKSLHLPPSAQHPSPEVRAGMRMLSRWLAPSLSVLARFP